MKHASAAALDTLEPVLAQIRALGAFKEPTPGVFYLRSRAFLHFHEDPAGLFTDLRAPGAIEFERLKIDSHEGRAALMAAIRATVNL